MMHARVVQHLEIDLVGVKETEERPESEKDRPLEPISLAPAGRERLCAISYLDTIFHSL